MASFDVVLRSEEYGGTSTITVAGGTFGPASNGVIFSRQPGGSGAAEVKIGSIEVTPNHVSVQRNGGDGTHFTLAFAILVPDGTKSASLTITNSQGGGPNPAVSFVKVIRPGVSEVSNSATGAVTQQLTF